MARMRSRPLLLSAGVLLAHRCAGLTVDIAPGQRDCFVLEVDEGVPCSGNFELIEPNDDVGPLAVEVYGPAAGAQPGDTKPPTPIYESRGEVEGTFAFDALQGGEVSLCLSNGIAGEAAGSAGPDGVARTVGFALRAAPLVEGGEALGADGKAELATEEHVTALAALVTEFSEGVATMVDHQSYMRQREEHHRDMTESTNAKVLWWTIGESTVLLILALWQIVYIRKFFEVKRYV